MRTIHVNAKAVAIFVLIASLIIVSCVIFAKYNEINLSDENLTKINPQNQTSRLLVRDLQFRQYAEKSLDKNVIAKPALNVQNTSSVDLERRLKVVEMIRHAWNGYRNYTFGANELKPVSKSAHDQSIFGGSKMMATIADGADTLWIAGLMEEYNQARNYIRDNFDISKASSSFSVFEITIRHVGGFLALYALTKEAFYIEKAKSIVDMLLPAFDTPTGIPKSLMNPRTGRASNYQWAYDGSSILSEIGSLHLEFRYLTQLTGNKVYLEKVETLRDVLDKTEKRNGFYTNYISPTTGEFASDDVSMGAMGDSFYEYLLKEWIHSNKTDQQSIRMYKEASKTLRNRLAFKSKDNITYIAEMRSGTVEHKMGHLACFAPGMFALEGYLEEDSAQRSEIFTFAEELGRTCHKFYEKSESGIGPEMVYFDEGVYSIRNDESGFVLRPEAIEGWFYLWRTTKKPAYLSFWHVFSENQEKKSRIKIDHFQIYKEWVWNAVTAIDKYCRVENGFVGLKNVNDIQNMRYDDVQQSFFIAETLKYAYLTFDDNLLPLDRWVFNTEAHAFPIQSR